MTLPPYMRDLIDARAEIERLQRPAISLDKAIQAGKPWFYENELAKKDAEIKRLRALLREAQKYECLSSKLLDDIDAALKVTTPMKGKHEWFKPDWLKWECCKVCGIVRREDGIPNSPCRGPVKVGLRAENNSPNLRALAAKDTKP